MHRPLARILSRWLSRQTLSTLAPPPAAGDEKCKGDHPHSPRALKWAWAVAVSGAIAAELLLSCRGALHPLVEVFIEAAGLEQTCRGRQEGP